MRQKKYIKEYIEPALDDLYKKDMSIFQNNLCERCIAFRFAHYLQNKFDKDKNNKYFVDCDYNSSVYFNKKTGKLERRNGKPISEENQGKAKMKKRFIDIIVHKRGHNKDENNWSDLICFELKKWNSNNSPDKNGIRPSEKDRNNLEKLTSIYGYKYGFHLIFGKEKEKTEIEIFKNGKGQGLELLSVVLNKKVA
jgi:hypothetical protein